MIQRGVGMASDTSTNVQAIIRSTVTNPRVTWANQTMTPPRGWRCAREQNRGTRKRSGSEGRVTGRWYEAVGGLALEVQREEGGSWQFAGCIQKKRGSFDIHVNPYQDHGYTLSSHSTLDEAKAALLKRYGVTGPTEAA